MKKEEAIKLLRDNPVFWSRLGFCYDPPIADENGEPLVFQKDFSKQLSSHDSFSDVGVKIHTCILHSGWVGVDKYDYSLCDKVIDGIFASGKTQYFIPRIKLNVPLDWCRENPTEVFVYENGPQTEQEIASLAGTLKQDYLGYESEVGYYNANGWKDTRPNVGGMISLQSFSSKKWLCDAGEALKRLVLHLEASPYADKILAYHIAFGACGETMPWGRQSGRFGDYGITNKKAFLDWGIKKYGSQDALSQVWGDYTGIVPPSEMREKQRSDSDGFYKDENSDRWSIDYDMFTCDVNIDALEHFGRIVKENTNDKATGAFYGYIIHMPRSPYAGHLGFERLIESEYIDFIAAPKSYFRCVAGEPGGEMAPTVTVNRKKLWVDECDNRTHLAVGEKLYGFADAAEETYTVHLRELCKNISHNSGLWYMDLGGGWFDDEGIMDNISRLMKASERIRRRKHESRAQIVAVMDEKSVMLSHPDTTERVENFLRNLQLAGAPVDIVYSFDIENADLSGVALAVVLTPLCFDTEAAKLLRNKLPENAKILYCGKTSASDDFEFIPTENVLSPEFRIKDREGIFPIIKDEEDKIICAENKNGEIALSSLETSTVELRSILQLANVKLYAPAGCAVYADNRIVSFFASRDIAFVPPFYDEKAVNMLSGEEYKMGTPIAIPAKRGIAFEIE